MKILVIEDDTVKCAEVVRCLTSGLTDGSLEPVKVAENLSDAMRVLDSQTFDLIILDLMLPFIDGMPADVGAGLELLKQIRSKESRNSAAAIVGLSGFPDELRDARVRFDEHGVLILSYDESRKWHDAILRIADDVQIRSGVIKPVAFLILVALEEELEGFAAADLTLYDRLVVEGLAVQHVHLPEDPLFKGVIVRLRQMGLAAAINDTAAAIKLFKPDIVCMSGICAGFKGNAKLGQLIIASPSWEYQSGKWSDNGFEVAAYQIPMRAETRAIIEQAVSSVEFLGAIERDLPLAISRPRRRVPPKLAPAVTGSAVIADAARLEHIKVQHRKVAALDMETFGVYFACHESYWSIRHYFSIKCVVDLADDNKDDDLHEYGCISSARAVVKAVLSLRAAVN